LYKIKIIFITKSSPLVRQRKPVIVDIQQSRQRNFVTQTPRLLTSLVGLSERFNGRVEFTRDIKGKSVLLQTWSRPDGSRKLRFPDFMTTAQGGGKVVSLTHRPHLPPGNSPGTHFC